MGSGKRMTFGSSEVKLSEWIAQNAFVAFHLFEKPWILAHELIANVCLPLNCGSESQPLHPFSTDGIAEAGEAEGARSTCDPWLADCSRPCPMQVTAAKHIYPVGTGRPPTVSLDRSSSQSTKKASVKLLQNPPGNGDASASSSWIA